MKIKTRRTCSQDPDFVRLVQQLDIYLKEKDGDEHAFYNQYNRLESIKYAIVAYENGKPLACGAIKEYSRGVMEIKRMYTLPECRSKGIASRVLEELEDWARELGYKKCILETGKRQEEAVNFYKKNNYTLIPNYGQYSGVENSLCFEKTLC